MAQARATAHGRARVPSDLGAPLYVAWQITNECNLACLHCIEESGPGKTFKDELDDAQVFAVLEQLMDLEVPYLSFSGGEPMVHPQFFEMVEYVCARGSQLKVETNGHYLTPENCARLQRPRRQGGAGEPRRRDRARHSTACACAAISTARSRACATCALPACPSRSTYSPTRFNVHEIGARGRPRARARRVQLLHRAHDVHRQRGEGVAPPRAVRMSSTSVSSTTLHARPRSTAAACACISTRRACSRSCATACTHPAALLIVLPNGLVKLINALPFICGDLRTQTLAEIWAQLPARVAATRAWREFVDDLARDPGQDTRRCTNGSIFERAIRRSGRRRCGRWLLRVCSLVRYRFFLYAGLLPYLLGAAWACAHRRHVRRARCSGAASAASCSRSSASRRSTSTSTRAWAPTACSIPHDLPPMSDCGALARRRRLRRRARGRHLPDACAAAGRSSRSRCWAAWRRSSMWRRRSAGPIAAWARLVIALSYGPWMVLGSLYLHTRRAVVGRAVGLAGAGTARSWRSRW